MATKTITITTDAYARLAMHKTGKESFSDVITKLAGRGSLHDLIGVLSNDGARELERNIVDFRKRMRKNLDEVRA
ncbi:MAG: antitoxin VapB family protein [Nanoarchaeota archaeon]